jgi:hypothetical protein
MTNVDFRQRVRDLDSRRRQLIEDALRPLPMMVGYLFQMRRRCGRAGCRCGKGKLHVSWYLSRRVAGKTKLAYIGRLVPDGLAPLVRRYRDVQQSLAAIRKIDREISELLNRIRDEKLSSLEEERRR